VSGVQKEVIPPADTLKFAMFIIEDERHSEFQEGEFSTLAEALRELKRRAALPWNEAPNQAPCMSWRTCGRTYEIVEYDMSITPWKELQRLPVLDVTASGAKWLSSIVE
jgi:hypothetical protein